MPKSKAARHPEHPARLRRVLRRALARMKESMLLPAVGPNSTPLEKLLVNSVYGKLAVRSVPSP